MDKKDTDKRELNIGIGRRLKEKRREAGYTREKFSELTGISVRFLADVESGKSAMSVSNLYKCCDVLNASSDYILMARSGQSRNFELTEKINCLEERYITVISAQVDNVIKTIELTKSQE